MTIEDALADGIRRLGAAVPPDAPARLAAYLRLLAQWNRAYNLTAVRGLDAMVVRHALDSLSVLPWLPGDGGRLIDVGSGAGLPGIPLAIARPGLRVTLLDSAGKRVRFMRQAVLELTLANVEVVQSRVEDYRPPQPFAAVVSRAFASLADMAASAGHLCTPGGRLLAMKGQRPDDEIAALPPGFAVLGVHALAVPGLAAERHLVEIAPPRAH